MIKSKKTLIIDFDLINNNLYSIFGVHKIPKEMKEKINNIEFVREFKLNEKNINKLTVKVDRNTSIISSTEVIFDEKYIVNLRKIEEMINYLKRDYDLILIDTICDTKYTEIIRALVNFSTKVICLTEGNLINIKKTTKILNKYINEKEKVSIVYNKKNKYTINQKVLEFIYFKFNLIGVLNYDNRYNQIINKNVNKLYITKKIKKEFEQTIKRLQIN